MCGFVSIVSDFPVEREILSAMSDQLSHRGPSSTGFHQFKFHSKYVSLAFQRLAIIDVSSAGDQPFISDCSNYIVQFNGEIYNYQDIRNLLVAQGVSFKSKTDTEVILEAYKYYGHDLCHKLEGMYAIVIFDLLLGQVFIARDPFGEKPLYISQPSSELTVISSEQKAIFSHPLISASPNLDHIYSRVFSSVHYADQSIFDDVTVFPAAHYSFADISLPHFIPRRFWRSLVCSGSANPYFDPAFIDNLMSKLSVSFDQKFLNSDVPIGLMLSGGIDSTILLNYLSRDHNISTFSCIFPGMEGDESAVIASNLTDLNASSYFLSPNFSDLLPQIVDMHWHMEDIIPGPSMFLEWELYRLAASMGFKVLLDGQGADECFAGYSQHLLYHRQCSSSNSENSLSDLTDQTYIDPSYAFRFSEMPSAFELWYHYAIEYQDLPTNLFFGDRSSMAHSIELRHPYLSTQIFSLLDNINLNYLISQPYSKNLLRLVGRKFNLLPKHLIKQTKKIGFEFPYSILSQDIAFLRELELRLQSSMILDLFPSFLPHISYLQESISPSKVISEFQAYWKFYSLSILLDLFEKNTWDSQYSPSTLAPLFNTLALP